MNLQNYIITKWWDYPRSPSVFVSFQCCPEEDLRSKLQEKENLGADSFYLIFWPLFSLLSSYVCDTITIILIIIMSSSPRQRENCFAPSHPSHLRHYCQQALHRMFVSMLIKQSLQTKKRKIIVGWWAHEDKSKLYHHNLMIWIDG